MYYTTYILYIYIYIYIYMYYTTYILEIYRYYPTLPPTRSLINFLSSAASPRLPRLVGLSLRPLIKPLLLLLLHFLLLLRLLPSTLSCNSFFSSRHNALGVSSCALTTAPLTMAARSSIATYTCTHAQTDRCTDDRLREAEQRWGTGTRTGSRL